MTAIITTSNSLTDLAARIRAEHEAVCLAARTTLDHAFRAGELLLDAKQLVGHGYWTDWLHEHCNISERSAQKYMQLARHRAAFEAPSTADLTIDEALRSLAKPRPPVEIEADYFAVPSADYLPTQEGMGRIGELFDYDCNEILGVKADPKHPDYFHVAHIEVHSADAAMSCEPDGGRPVRADFVKDWFLYAMRRPDRFDKIEWRDHPVDRWPFPEPKPRWPTKEWIEKSRTKIADDEATDDEVAS